MDVFIDILVIALMFLLGISVGSFLNVVADRIPAGKSIVSPPSHCFSCGHRLENRDLIPLISYLALRGKCRYCGTSISARSFMVELITGILLVLIWLRFGVSWQLLTGILYCSFLMVLAVTDYEQSPLPGVVVYAGTGLALMLAVLGSVIGFPPGILSASIGLLAGFGLIFLVWLASWLAHKKILLFAHAVWGGLIGAFLGFPLVIVALCLSIPVGLLIILIFRPMRIRKGGETKPWGPLLALSAVISLLCGDAILSWIYPVFAGLIK